MRIADVSRETGLSRNTVTLLYRETAARVDLDAITSYASFSTARWGSCWSASSCRPRTLDDILARSVCGVV